MIDWNAQYIIGIHAGNRSFAEPNYLLTSITTLSCIYKSATASAPSRASHPPQVHVRTGRHPGPVPGAGDAVPAPHAALPATEEERGEGSAGSTGRVLSYHRQVSVTVSALLGWCWVSLVVLQHMRLSNG